jgi:hypothetical protein
MSVLQLLLLLLLLKPVVVRFELLTLLGWAVVDDDACDDRCQRNGFTSDGLLLLRLLLHCGGKLGQHRCEHRPHQRIRRAEPLNLRKVRCGPRLLLLLLRRKRQLLLLLLKLLLLLRQNLMEMRR